MRPSRVYSLARSPRRALLPNTRQPKEATFSTTALTAWLREHVTRVLDPLATLELMRCQMVVDFPMAGGSGEMFIKPRQRLIHTSFRAYQ